MRAGFIKDKVPVLYFALFSLVLGISLPFFIDKLENPLNIFILLLFPVALYALVKYPEIPFVLFINAGIYKADPRLHLPEFLDLTVLFGIIATIGIIFSIIRKKIRLVIPPMKMFLPFFIIMMLAITSFAYTEAPICGREKLLRLLTLTSFAMFAPLFLFQSEHSIKRFFITYVLLAMGMFLDVISRGLYTNKWGFVEAFGSSGYLGMGKFSGEALFILSFYLLLSVKTKIYKTFIIGLLICTAFLSLVSGTKASVLALAIVFLVILVYNIGHIAKRNLFLKRMQAKNREILIVSIITLCAFAFTTVYFKEYFFTFFSRAKLLISGEFDSVRLYQYEKALEALSSFPSGLVGLGIGGFSMFAHGYDQKRGVYVHNIFLDIGAELGIFGLISFSLLIYWGFATAFRTLKKAKDTQYYTGITLISLFLFMLFWASVHGNINDNRSLLTWLGSIYAYKRMMYQREAVVAFGQD